VCSYRSRDLGLYRYVCHLRAPAIVPIDHASVSCSLIPVKRFLLSAIHSLTRSDFAARGDAYRAESRAEMFRMASQGKAWDAMSKNVSYMGIRTDSGSKPKMIFGACR